MINLLRRLNRTQVRLMELETLWAQATKDLRSSLILNLEEMQNNLRKTCSFNRAALISEDSFV